MNGLTLALFVLAGFLAGGALSMHRQHRTPVAGVLGAGAALALAAGVLRL